MKYKLLIIKMILSMENEDYLCKVYHYLLAKYRRENEAAERRGRQVKNNDCLTEYMQEIIMRVQTVKNPELLMKILTFIKCWTNDEGGQTDGKQNKYIWNQ